MQQDAISRRRFLIAGAGASAAALLTTPASPALASLYSRPGHVQWGGFSRPRRGETYIDSTQRMEALIGRKLDVTRHYLDWNGRIVSDSVRWSAGGGRVPFIAVSTDGKVKWSAIAHGQHDDRIHQMASEIKAWGRKAIITLDHEPESQTVNADAGTPAEYGNAYDHFHAIFTNMGVRNLTWACVLQAATYHGAHGGPRIWYPLSHHVLGSDGYNRTPHDWRPFSEVFGPGHAEAVRHRKPFFIGEWGCIADRRKPEWFRRAEDTMRGWKNLQAAIYTHEIADYRGHDVDFRVNSDPNSLRNFRRIGHEGYFGG